MSESPEAPVVCLPTFLLFDTLLILFKSRQPTASRPSGWTDVHVPESVKDDQLRCLAGEGMALPCLASIIWSLYLTKGFPKKSIG